MAARNGPWGPIMAATTGPGPVVAAMVGPPDQLRQRTNYSATDLQVLQSSRTVVDQETTRQWPTSDPFSSQTSLGKASELLTILHSPPFTSSIRHCTFHVSQFDPFRGTVATVFISDAIYFNLAVKSDAGLITFWGNWFKTVPAPAKNPRVKTFDQHNARQKNVHASLHNLYFQSPTNLC